MTVLHFRENIDTEKLHNFDVYPEQLVNDHSVSYDYLSIMHYGEKVNVTHVMRKQTLRSLGMTPTTEYNL